ncbi:MAG: hypothetical protein SCM96_15245 [Acidobacteriota bacterium]|nr:hypothetical protein [Acidobacteriota bacterium]
MGSDMLENNKEIAAYDHADTCLREMMNSCKIPVETMLAKICQIKLAICHVHNENEWMNFIEKSKPGSIRIRTSTQGRAGQKHYIKDNVIVLELQKGHNFRLGGVQQHEWEFIISELKKNGIAERIVKGDVPNNMISYFGNLSLEVLPALSILCQGYLMVHFAANPKLTKDLKVKESEDLLKLAEFAREYSFPRELQSLVEEVESPDFWNVFDSDNNADLTNLRAEIMKDVNNEWGMDSINRIAPVINLIEQLGKSIPAPELVIDAYLEIIKKLK